MRKRLLLGLLCAIPVGVAAFLFGLRMNVHPENQKPGKFPEQLVFVRLKDDVVNAGVMFTSPKQSSKPLAIIWVHGWGANFYTPSYVGIGRALAERGFPTISVNTRMHDMGNVEKYTLSGKRVRGGGYWGVTSEVHPPGGVIASTRVACCRCTLRNLPLRLRRRVAANAGTVIDRDLDL
jgi:hypothetical protein